MEQPLWTEAAPSAFPWEREALDFIRTRLPDHEPYRAWSNIEFIGSNGSANEVDLFVVTPRGAFLVEIKSHPGKLFGDQASWKLDRDGRISTKENPFLLANSKAKRLQSLLDQQPAFRRDKVQMPYVQALVFLSNKDLICRLHPVGRANICGRDGEQPHATEHFPALPGIVATVMAPDAAGLKGNRIDKPMSRRIAEAAKTAGFKPNDRTARLGDFTLDTAIDEGPDWQDFEATNAALKLTRRARVFLSGRAHTKAQEAEREQEARRAYLLAQGLQHDGILRPLHLDRHVLGPALLYERDPDEERLDTWAPAHLLAMDIAERAMLVRQLADAMHYAHGRGVVHRTLTPKAVLVRTTRTGGTTLVIDHWHAGAQDVATEHIALTRAAVQGSTTLHANQLPETVDRTDVFLAPEATTVAAPSGRAMDVFGVGALAYLLLTGRPPAGTLAERDELLGGTRQGFTPGSAADGIPDDLQFAVELATDPQASERPTMEEMLGLIDRALEELTRPEVVDPLDAYRTSELEGGWQVLRYLGKGGTAVALLVEDGAGTKEVLKVAKDEAYADRLRAEHQALSQLRHDGIVACHGITTIAGRTVLRLEPASVIEKARDDGAETLRNLAARLQAEGRPNNDLVERWGDDLLEIVVHLESRGVAHRDIKPENLGVRYRGKNTELHLALFDFSLANTPDNQIAAGTVGYLDPFLAQRPTRRWDQAAERYAAAVTLYELATGTRPVWGDGLSDPALGADDLPRIDADLFDERIRDGLVAFFRTALHRNPEHRHHTAMDMRRAWQRAFHTDAGATTTPVTEAPSDDDVEFALQSVEADTPVAQLPLSGSAVDALDRLGIHTAAALAQSTPNSATPGVGKRVMREISSLARRLRERLDADEVVDTDGDSADALVLKVVPQSEHAPVLRALLGLDPALAKAWPSRTDVTAALHITREAYDKALKSATHRWSRKPFGELRVEITAILDEMGGVASADEVARGLLARRGSAAEGEARLQAGRALVRAALEADRASKSPGLVERRHGEVLVLTSSTDDDNETALDLADHAAELGTRAQQLVDRPALPTPTQVVEELRAVPLPEGCTPLSDLRLVRLAAATSRSAAISPRGELYPRGMAAAQALALCRTVLIGRGLLTEDLLRRRVEDRFPEAAPLPEGEELVRLVKDTVGLEVVTEHGQRCFQVPRPPVAQDSTYLQRTSVHLATGSPAWDEAARAAAATDERLARLAAEGGYVVASVADRHLLAAEERLRALGYTLVSLEEQLLERMHRIADEQRRAWDRTVLATDADGPGGRNWGRLCDLAGDAAKDLEASLLGMTGPVALTRPGLLARYDRMEMLDRLRGRVTRQMTAHQTLAAVVVLVPAPDASAAPEMEGRAVPYVGDNQRLHLTSAWVLGTHRPGPVRAPSAVVHRS